MLFKGYWPGSPVPAIRANRWLYPLLRSLISVFRVKYLIEINSKKAIPKKYKKPIWKTQTS
jgi:hypothetical protein